MKYMGRYLYGGRPQKDLGVGEGARTVWAGPPGEGLGERKARSMRVALPAGRPGKGRQTARPCRGNGIAERRGGCLYIHTHI